MIKRDDGVWVDVKCCPFCGSHSLGLCKTDCYPDVDRYSIYVRCAGCMAESGGCDTEEEALAVWNRREGKEER